MTPVQRPQRRLSPATRARVKINRIKAALPLFDHAGILDQVADIAYDARRIVDEDFARAIGSDLFWQDKARYEQRQYAMYIAFLDEVIGQENREEIEADYAERWRDHSSMRQMVYRISYLNTYLANYLKRTPLEIFEEAKRRQGNV